MLAQWNHESCFRFGGLRCLRLWTKTAFNMMVRRPCKMLHRNLNFTDSTHKFPLQGFNLVQPWHQLHPCPSMMATGPPSSKKESPETMLPALGTTSSQNVDKTTRNNETTSAVLLEKCPTTDSLETNLPNYSPSPWVLCGHRYMITKACLGTASHVWSWDSFDQTFQLRQERPACKTRVTRKPQHESHCAWNYGEFTRFITFHHVSSRFTLMAIHSLLLRSFRGVFKFASSSWSFRAARFYFRARKLYTRLYRAAHLYLASAQTFVWTFSRSQDSYH